MAEFCLKCFNEINETSYRENEVWLEEDLCEDCGEWRRCVMGLRPRPLAWRLMDAIGRLLRK